MGDSFLAVSLGNGLSRGGEHCGFSALGRFTLTTHVRGAWGSFGELPDWDVVAACIFFDGDPLCVVVMRAWYIERKYHDVFYGLHDIVACFFLEF